MSQIDFVYVNKTPAAAGAPTTDGGANDPDGAALANAGIGSLETTDKYVYMGIATNLVFFNVGGNPTLELWFYSATLKAWVLWQGGIIPTPTVPARVKVPPYMKLYIRVATLNLATAIYALYDVG